MILNEKKNKRVVVLNTRTSVLRMKQSQRVKFTIVIFLLYVLWSLLERPVKLSQWSHKHKEQKKKWKRSEVQSNRIVFDNDAVQIMLPSEFIYSYL